MGRVQADLVASAVGAFSRCQEEVASSGASVRSNKTTSSTSSYRTRNGYQMSTNFSDNIKIGRRKRKGSDTTSSISSSVSTTSLNHQQHIPYSTSNSKPVKDTITCVSTTRPTPRKSIAELKQQRREERERNEQNEALPPAPTMTHSISSPINLESLHDAKSGTTMHCRSLPSPAASPHHARPNATDGNATASSSPKHINETPCSSIPSSLSTPKKLLKNHSLRTMLESKHRPIIITNADSNDTASVTSKNSSSTLKKRDGFWKFGKKRQEPVEKEKEQQQQQQLRPPSPVEEVDIGGIYPIFGLPLEQAIKFNTPFESTDIFAKSDTVDRQICDLEYQKYVPLVVLKCIKFIFKHGLEEEGLYRMSGSTQDVKRLQRRFLMEGPTFDIGPQEEVHTVTSLFKQYLRDLPDDLVTVEQHPYLAYDPAQMMAQQELPFESIPTQVLQDELVNLPFVNFALLHVLIRHFAAVVDHQQDNRMTLSNMAMVFAPTLRMNRLLFMALVAKGDLLWKDLHPSTPKPVMDPTFNSVEPYTADKEDFDSVYADFDFTYSQPTPRPIGMGISTVPEEHSVNSMGMSVSSISTRSLRSLDSSPDTVMTDPDSEYYHQPPKFKQARAKGLSIDVTRSKNRALNPPAKSPRLFLGPSNSFSAPATPLH